MSRFWILLAAIALAPTGAPAQEPHRATRGIAAEEVRAAHSVSQALFRVQAEERAEAKALRLDELLADLQQLRSAARDYAAHERLPLAPSAVPPDQKGSARERLYTALARLQARRAEIESRLSEVASPRQKHLARRALEKIAELEAEARGASEGPADERAPRLSALADRLEATRHGFPAMTGPEPRATPTLQVAPKPQRRLPPPNLPSRSR